MKMKFRYQYFIIVILIESVVADWFLFHSFSDFTRLTVISAISGMFITVEGILIGLSPMIKVPFMRDIALAIGVGALLTAVGAFSVSIYDTTQNGYLSANSVTYFYWNPAWVLFLILVEWYVLAIIFPLQPDINIQLRQMKKKGP